MEHDDAEDLPSITSIASTVLAAPPSCVAFVPHHENIVIVGTYSLHEASSESESNERTEGISVANKNESQSRSGSLIILEWAQGEAQTLKLLHTEPVDGAVLDLQFSPKEDRRDYFAVTTSIGYILVYRWMPEEQPHMQLGSKITICEPSILILSLSWVPSSPQWAVVAVSTSIGEVIVFDTGWSLLFDNIIIPQKARIHSLEAWTVAWSMKGPDAADNNYLLYSGGDDSCFQTLRVDIEDKAMELGRSLAVSSSDKRNHKAGVTAILPLTSFGEEEILLTGSYDEYARIIIQDPNKNWIVRCEKRLDGGVWRLKLMSERPGKGEARIYRVLASCMHAGARIIDIVCAPDECSIEVVAKFVEHESMNYGSDFAKGSNVVVSTSFYDRKLCLWRPPDE